MRTWRVTSLNSSSCSLASTQCLWSSSQTRLRPSSHGLPQSLSPCWTCTAPEHLLSTGALPLHELLKDISHKRRKQSIPSTCQIYAHCCSYCYLNFWICNQNHLRPFAHLDLPSLLLFHPWGWHRKGGEGQKLGPRQQSPSFLFKWVHEWNTVGLCECVLHKMISCETGFSANNILQKHLLVTGSCLIISRRKNLEHLNRSLIIWSSTCNSRLKKHRCGFNWSSVIAEIGFLRRCQWKRN